MQGVISASAGNHALALSYHGQRLGVPVTVVMPTIAPITKVSKCRSFGANVNLHGITFAEARAQADLICEEQGRPCLTAGLTYVNGFNDPPIIAGAGTIGSAALTTGLEIVKAMPDVEAVLVPVGGGGLIAGIALAIKTLQPHCRVIGVGAA